MGAEGRIPMSFSHGDFDDDYLRRVVLRPDGTPRFRSVSWALHIDSTMRGRRGAEKPATEAELDPFRAEACAAIRAPARRARRPLVCRAHDDGHSREPRPGRRGRARRHPDGFPDVLVPAGRIRGERTALGEGYRALTATPCGRRSPRARAATCRTGCSSSATCGATGSAGGRWSATATSWRSRTTTRATPRPGTASSRRSAAIGCTPAAGFALRTLRAIASPSG